MPKGTCSICGDAHYARGWCRNHYRRWMRYDDPLGGTWPSADAACTIGNCKEPHLARGMCEKHYRRWHRTGDPLVVRERPPQAGVLNFNWRGDAVKYSGLHLRVRKERGPASAQVCAHADETCKGRLEWANISHEYLGVEDFMPLCQSHHVRYDREAG